MIIGEYIRYMVSGFTKPIDYLKDRCAVIYFE